MSATASSSACSVSSFDDTLELSNINSKKIPTDPTNADSYKSAESAVEQSICAKETWKFARS